MSKSINSNELSKAKQERMMNFIYYRKVDLMRLKCQNNAKKNGLNCPMFVARYLNQNYNFCSDCDHMNVSE